MLLVAFQTPIPLTLAHTRSGLHHPLRLSPSRLSPAPLSPSRRRPSSSPSAILPAIRASLPALPLAQISSAASVAAPFAIWAVILSAATVGLASQKTAWGTALSPPLVTTLATLILANLHLLPTIHPIYTAVNTTLVPLAVPLLLLGADLRRVLRETGRLLAVFISGAISTVLATIIAWRLVPLRPLGPQAWKIAAALCARHIGGAVNYVAVAEATAAPPGLVAAALAADNVVVALFFLLLLFLARNVQQPKQSTVPATSRPSTSSPPSVKPDRIGEDTAITHVCVTDAAVSLALSAAMCAIGAFISNLLPFNFGPIPLATAVVLFTATAFPNRLRPYRQPAAAVGIFFMQIFFAVTGAGGSIVSVLRKAPVLLVFSIIQLAFHLTFLFLIGRLFNFHRAEILVASNANVGGPTTAAAMAAAKKWDTLVVPSLLVGVFGYSVATFVSLGLGYAFLRVY